MQIRLGYELAYQCPQPTPMILTLNVHYSRAADLVKPDNMLTNPWVPLTLYRDGFGNWCTRLVAPPGLFRITADALINDRGVAEPVVSGAQQHAVEALPEETLVYLLGSRYCDTDNLSEIAWKQFGNMRPAGRECRQFAPSSMSGSSLGMSLHVRPAPRRKHFTNVKACVATTRIWPSLCVDV